MLVIRRDDELNRPLTLEEIGQLKSRLVDSGLPGLLWVWVGRALPRPQQGETPRKSRR